MSCVDLHIHSSASDGTIDPREIVTMAQAQGLETIALTDHDTVAGLAAAREQAAVSGIRVIPGLEISADEDGVQAHILGYGIDPEDPALVASLERFAQARLERVRSILERLDALGIALPAEQLCGPAAGCAVGRPHVARLLLQEGHVSSLSEAFERFLSHRQAAYVPRPKVSMRDAIAMIHAAGGLAVLAHPWSITWLIEPLVEQGLDGLEVFYRDYDACQQGRLARLAQEHGLVATGGSDYHGPEGIKSTLGSVHVPRECVAALDARLAR
ncbi:MAG: PHP domain-containing protein [Anaerolineae bacterium]|jgi:predicted metal-dependent phosphoesterase TrpH|nr:PHP domain-containing protein [Chloroflexota bacterium]